MRVVNMAHGAFFLLGGYIALKLQRHRSARAARFGLTSDQVNLVDWVLPRSSAARWSARIGLVMQQLFLRWNQGQELRQALITIAISIILADQMLAHFGGIAQDIAWPGTLDSSSNLRVAGIQYTTTRLFILGDRDRARRPALALAQADAHRHGHPRRRRRPRDGLARSGSTSSSRSRSRSSSARRSPASAA